MLYTNLISIFISYIEKTSNSHAVLTLLNLESLLFYLI